MMNFEQRIDLMVSVGRYMLSGDDDWQEAIRKASLENAWFTPEFCIEAINNIVGEFLQKEKLAAWCRQYHDMNETGNPKNVGLVMAGNIPLVGFHDFLSVFLSGHKQVIKPSSKDAALLPQIAQYLFRQERETANFITFAEKLTGCDAYIATGSNNSARYFEYYFEKYPHIIRRNRTSVAILDGSENHEELEGLSADISMYFGLGCRNVTKLYVPEQYDFLPLLNALKKFDYFADHRRYKNNYDYQLAILIINSKYYLTNGSIILTENSPFFSPISVLHFQYYTQLTDVEAIIEKTDEIQCIAGRKFLPFGKTQHPSLSDYADGIDTMKFLTDLY
jgi:hypothetical protein